MKSVLIGRVVDYKFSDPAMAILTVLMKAGDRELDIMQILYGLGRDFDEIDHLQTLITTNKLRKMGFLYGDTLGYGLTEKGREAFRWC